MRGTNHSIMGLTTLGYGAITGYLFLTDDNISRQVKDCTVAVRDFLFDNGNLSVYVFYPLIFILYMLGCLLPDIDYPYSRIGRIIYLPIKHRTWTHAIYVPAVLLIIGIYVRCVFWLGLGYLVHLICDSFSASGISWFYPHKNRHHICKLYTTSHISETIVVFMYIILLIVYCVFVVL